MDYPTDLVYLWVDGSDPAWCERKNFWLKKADAPEHEMATPERWQDNDELKFSLRSVEAFVPWVHHIFIVTDQQRPKWFNTNSQRVTIVDHKDFIPEEFLPTFCADVIESFLPRIPGLSEHFLFANDDMFFGRPVSPNIFFDKNNNPIVFVKQLHPDNFCQDPVLRNTLLSDLRTASRIRANILIYEKFHKNMNWEAGHVIDPCRKSYLLEALSEESFQKALYTTRIHKFRSPEAVQRILFPLYDSCKNRTTLKNIKKWKEIKRLIAPHTIPLYLSKEKDFEKCLKIHPDMFCFYDNGNYYDNLKPFLEAYFPFKSSCEL